MADEVADKSRLYRTSSKRLSTPLIVTVVLILAVLLGGGYLFFQSQHPTKDVQSPLPSAAPTTIPTETPTPTLEATPSGKVTTTPSKTTPTVTSKPGTSPTTAAGTVDRSSITIIVLNGSGTAGAASKISTYLEGLGYTISSTGNAETFDYEGLTINVKSSKSSILSQLKKDLTSQGTIDSSTSTYTGTGDAQVIVGK